MLIKNQFIVPTVQMTSRNLARIDGRNVRGRWASFQIDYMNPLEYHRSIRIALNSESNYAIVSCAAVLVGPLGVQFVSHWEGFKEGIVNVESLTTAKKGKIPCEWVRLVR